MEEFNLGQSELLNVNISVERRLISLVPHRVLPLKHSLALISETNTGWCIINKDDYLTLKGVFYHGSRSNNEFDSEALEVLNVLRHSGLIHEDNEGSCKVTSEREINLEAVPRTLLIKVTGSCNISCTYCYDFDNVRFKQQLSPKRAVSIVDEFLNQTDAKLSIIFHGGEPLIRYDLVVAITQQLLTLRNAESRLTFSIQTNGTLLNSTIIKFLEEYNFSVGISLDGFTDNANKLRVLRDGSSTLDTVAHLFERFPSFMLTRVGFLAVVSQTSIGQLIKFALWLQDKGIRTFGFTFMDQEGSAKKIPDESINIQQAVDLIAAFVKLIENGEISSLNVTPITSRIANLFNLSPQDYCYRGPCGAASDFMVLDPDGSIRTCDCADHSFFRAADATVYSPNILKAAVTPRQAIVVRHEFLRENGKACSSCPIFGLCGGTCAAKAIISTGEIDARECAIAKYIYPYLLEQYEAYAESAKLIKYYLSFNNHKLN